MNNKKYNFYPKAKTLLNNHATRENIYELAKDYDISKEECDKWLNANTKKESGKSAVSQGKDAIKNAFLKADEDFVNLEYPTLHILSREDNREFYIYNTGVYTRLLDSEMETLVDKFFEKEIYHEFRQRNKDIKDFVKRVGLRLSRTQNRNWTPEKVEKQKYHLNLKNGLLDIETLELKGHSHEYFSTVQVPYEYNPEAIHPEFDKYLDTIGTKDSSVVPMLQEMFGYCLSDGNPRHKVFYMYGMTARNGKSTAGKILTGLLGSENCSALSLEQLSQGKALTSLVGKQLNFSDEVSTKYIESNNLTSLSAEGYIQIDPKFKTPYMHKVKTKFIIACNSIPRFGDEQGMKHRMIPIPFTYQIPEQERILNYHQILLEKEGSGILNWAIEGYKRVNQNNEFTMSKRALEDIEDNVLESNSVYAYLTQMFVFDEKHENRQTTQYLYGTSMHSNRDSTNTMYNLFCAEHGIKPLSYQKFCKELKKFSEETGKIKEKRQTDGSGYIGLEDRSFVSIDDF